MDRYKNTDYSDLILAIKNGNQQLLHDVYVQYREEFVSWTIARYHCDEDEAKDIYQEVIIAFYENIVKGNITALESTLKTYLFGIGKYLVIHHFKKNKRRQELLEQHIAPEMEAADWSILKKINQIHRQQVLRKAIDALGEKCRLLLTLFYYRRYAMEAIMRELNYKSPQVAKSSKIRCMNALRDLIEQRFKEELRD